MFFQQVLCTRNIFRKSLSKIYYIAMIRSKCIPIRDNCSRSFYSAILTCTALFTVHYVGVIKILGIFLHLSKASSETPPFIASHQPLLWMHFSNASHLYAPLLYATFHPTPPLNALFQHLSSTIYAPLLYTTLHPTPPLYPLFQRLSSTHRLNATPPTHPLYALFKRLSSSHLLNNFSPCTP